MYLTARTRPVLVLGLLQFGAGLLLAQGNTITGTIIDSASSKPLAGALVYVGQTAPGKGTGKDGKFRVDNVGAGAVVVVRHAGHVPKGITPPEAGGDVGTLPLRAVKTDEDREAVDIGNKRVFPQLADFYSRRKALSAGFFFTPDDVELSGARQPSDVVRRATGLRNVCVVDRQGAADCGDPTKRGTTYSGFQESGPCIAVIWTGGARARGALDEMAINDVLAIEAYAQPGSTPPDFAGSRCATIVVWMKP